MTHGTASGARQHYRRGEKPCPSCRAAAAAEWHAAAAEWHRRKGTYGPPPVLPGPMQCASPGCTRPLVEHEAFGACYVSRYDEPPTRKSSQ